MLTPANISDVLGSILRRSGSAQSDSDLFATISSFAQTSAEIAVGVTPTNFTYAPYHPFRYMTFAQIADVQAKTATLDVTVPLQTAIECAAQGGGGTVNLPEGVYLCGKLYFYQFVSVIGEGSDITELRRNPSDTTGTWLSVINPVVGSQFQGFTIGGFLMNGNFVGTNLGGIDLLNVNGGSKNFSIGTTFVLRDINSYHVTGIGFQIGFNAGTVWNLWSTGSGQGFYFYGVVGYAYFISSAGSTSEEIVIECDGFEAYGIETEWIGQGTNDATKSVIKIINQGKIGLYGVSNSGGTLVRDAIVSTNGNPYVTVQMLVKRGTSPTHSIDDNGTFYDQPVINYWANGPIISGLVDQLQTPSVTFPSTQIPSSNVNSLDDYREYTAPAAACTGALTNTITWKAVKVGRAVTVTIPGFTGTPAAQPSIVLGQALPAVFRPTTVVNSPNIQIVDNSAYQANPGMANIDSTTGVITIYKNGTTTANFTAAGAGGLPNDSTVTFMAAS